MILEVPPPALSPQCKAALLLAAKGWAVFPAHSMIGAQACSCLTAPCGSPGKHPATPHGLKDATTDEAVIRAMWERHARANVAVATGAVSGIVVLDVDAGKGGFETLARLEEEHGALPATLTVATGGGGLHLYFRHPGVPVRNSVRKLGPGLDIRGDGGYVIAPPSNHRSGGTYTWKDEREPAEMPAWLLARVGSAQPERAASSRREPGPAASASCVGATPYGLTALAMETLRVRTAPVGSRNDLLNRAAFALGQLVAGGEIDGIFAKRELMAAALAAGLSREETARTARSGFGKGLLHARSAPARTGAGDTIPSGDTIRGPSRLETGIVSPAPGRSPSGDGDPDAEGPDDDAQDAGPVRNVPPWTPFPVEFLPPVLRALVVEAAAAIGCDPSYVVLPVLAVVASAIGNSRTARLKDSWDEPCVVWTGIVGESGTQKSPAQDVAFAPLRRLDEEAQREHQENLNLHKAEKLRHEFALSEWRKGGAVGDPPPEPRRPVAHRFIVCDATTEAIAKLLAENERGVLLARDELAGWLRSFDVYRGGQGGDAAFYLSTFGARPHVVDRKGGDTPVIFVPRAALSISGAIQPGTLAASIGKEHRDDGLLARLLFAMPPRTVPRWTTVVVDPLTQAAYARTIHDLVGLELDVDGEGHSQPVPLPLTEEAMREWISFFNTFSERQGNTVGDEAAALSKLVGYAARFALIHQLARDPRASSIDAEAIRAGAALCRWFADEAVRVYAVLVETEEEAARRRLVEWIAAPPRHGTTTVRDLTRGPREYRSKTTAEEALNALQNAKLGSWEEVRHEGAGRPAWIFVLAKDAVLQVKKGQKEALPPTADLPGAGDTIRDSSLGDPRIVSPGAIVSPPVAGEEPQRAVVPQAAGAAPGQPVADIAAAAPIDLRQFEDDASASAADVEMLAAFGVGGLS